MTIRIQNITLTNANQEYTFTLLPAFRSLTFQARTAAAGAAGTVIWGLQGISYGDSDAIDVAWGVAQEVTDNWLANGDEHITGTTASITLAGTPAAEEDVQFRAYREVAPA